MYMDIVYMYILLLQNSTLRKRKFHAQKMQNLYMLKKKKKKKKKILHLKAGLVCSEHEKFALKNCNGLPNRPSTEFCAQNMEILHSENGNSVLKNGNSIRKQKFSPYHGQATGQAFP